MNTKSNISVAMLVRNESQMLPDALHSIENLAGEIVVVDDASTDNSKEIAQSFGAKVITIRHSDNFDANKQVAIDHCTKKWILLLDADERVSPSLAQELVNISTMNDEEQQKHQQTLPEKQKHIFERHTHMVQKGGLLDRWSDKDPIVAYFLPRKNFFLGKYLEHGGVYPDGVIRFFTKGSAHMDTSDLHKQLIVSGRVGWTMSPLLHMDSPTWGKYYSRWIRYTDFFARQLKQEKVSKNTASFLKFIVIKPSTWFLMTFIIRKGFLDGWQGFLFSLFSSLRFARAYILYIQNKI